MDSHALIAIEIKSNATENSDNEFEIVTPPFEPLSPQEQAQCYFNSAKTFIEENKIAQAILPIRNAINIYQNLENKTTDDWKILSTYYELDREIYYKQNQILLNTNMQMLTLLKEDAQNIKHLKESMKELQDDQNRYATSISMEITRIKNENSQYKEINFNLNQENLNLNQEIQSLRIRAEKTVLEHISSEICNTFNAIRRFNLSTCLANSFLSFFSSDNRSYQAVELDSPTLSHQKKI